MTKSNVSKSNAPLGIGRFREHIQRVNNPSNIDDYHSTFLHIGEDTALKGVLKPIVPADLENSSDFPSLRNWLGKYGPDYLVTDQETHNVPLTDWMSSEICSSGERALYWISDGLGVGRIGCIGVSLVPDDFSIEIQMSTPEENQLHDVHSLALDTIEEMVEQKFGFMQTVIRVEETEASLLEICHQLGYELDEDAPFTQGKKTNLKKNLHEKFSLPILTAGPHLDNEDFSSVYRAVRHEWNNSHSNSILKMQDEVAEKTGRKYAIATSSCTGAMHLSLLAAGIGRGDEVIVPNITWVATASAVEYAGAIPVFADVDEVTWTISADGIVDLITPRTKAIMPVHLYGVGPEMNKIMEIAHQFDLKVIEDAAPALGSIIAGSPAGSHGDSACFSFQGAKIAVSGEGGALVTDDLSLFERAKQLNDHGRKPNTFDIERIGFKYKMSNVTAGLAASQISKSTYLADRKRRINGWYREFLENCDLLRFQDGFEGHSPNFWMTSVYLEDGISASEVMTALKEIGIDSRPVFPTIGSFGLWTQRNKTPVADKIGKNAINLPSGSYLTRSQVSFVSSQLKEILGRRA